MRTYEGLFIFPEALKDDAVKALAERLKGEVEKLGGVVREIYPLGKRAFARPMSKQEAGHYVRITFDLDPLKVVSLEARCKLIEGVFRTQIVKPDKPAAAASSPVAAPAQAPAAAAEPAKEGTRDGVA